MNVFLAVQGKLVGYSIQVTGIVAIYLFLEAQHRVDHVDGADMCRCSDSYILERFYSSRESSIDISDTPIKLPSVLCNYNQLK